MLNRILLKAHRVDDQSLDNGKERKRMEKSRMDYDVYCGIDIGKTTHYVVALGPVSDARIMAGPLEQDEGKLKEVLSRLCSFGKVLVTIDQCGCIGRLVVSVAQRMGVDCAHIPPRTFKRVADTYGELKTDAHDAFIIADVSRSMPRLIALVANGTEVIEELKVLCSSRACVVKERTAYYNRLHALLHTACPPLEALFAGRALHSILALSLLARYGGPSGLKRAGKGRVARWAGAQTYQPTRGPELAGEVFDALAKMTVVLPATAVIEEEVKRLAARIIELEGLEAELDERIDARSASVPEVELLKSMLGMGDVLAPAIVAQIGDISRFEDADHLASYAGLAPVKKESGTSVKGAKKAKGGNRALKHALVQYAKTSLRHDPVALAYYQKKRSQNKNHNQALLALARRRVEVIYALLKTGAGYKALHEAV